MKNPLVLPMVFAIALFAAALARAEDKPQHDVDGRGRAAPRRPTGEDRPAQYPRHAELPTVAQLGGQLKRLVKAEFFPDDTDEQVTASIESAFGMIEGLERKRPPGEFAKIMLAQFRRKLESRQLGRLEGVERLFRAAGLMAHTAKLLQRRPDTDARRIEMYCEALRATAYLILREEGRAGAVEDEPFTYIETQRISEEEAAYRAAFLAEYRRYKSQNAR